MPLIYAVVTVMLLPTIINCVGYVVTLGAQPYMYRYLWQESMIRIFVCLSDHYKTHQDENHWRRMADDPHHNKPIQLEDVKYVAARDRISEFDARQKLQSYRDEEAAELAASGKSKK
ncbi:MAG TPA: hypothetical protein V6C89_18525 [Drouetiella sp.]